MAIEPFTFGIPLIARGSAPNWQLVEQLVELTLRSVAAQTDPDFRVLLCGHDRPYSVRSDAFLEADWRAEAVRTDNLDSGRKKHAISQEVLARGGGLLMFLDADDWVDVCLVQIARATIGAGHVGGAIGSGFAIDIGNRRALPLPHPGAFKGGFYELCGSSTIARLDPHATDPVRRNPIALLHEHYRWNALCREHGLQSADLPCVGGYVINTSVNHSTISGPFAKWRRSFDQRVLHEGGVVDDAFLAQFGLDQACLREIDETLRLT